MNKPQKYIIRDHGLYTISQYVEKYALQYLEVEGILLNESKVRYRINSGELDTVDKDEYAFGAELDGFMDIFRTPAGDFFFQPFAQDIKINNRVFVNYNNFKLTPKELTSHIITPIEVSTIRKYIRDETLRNYLIAYQPLYYEMEAPWFSMHGQWFHRRLTMRNTGYFMNLDDLQLLFPSFTQLYNLGMDGLKRFRIIFRFIHTEDDIQIFDYKSIMIRNIPDIKTELEKLINKTDYGYDPINWENIDYTSIGIVYPADLEGGSWHNAKNVDINGVRVKEFYKNKNDNCLFYILNAVLNLGYGRMDKVRNGLGIEHKNKISLKEIEDIEIKLGKANINVYDSSLQVVYYESKLPKEDDKIPIDLLLVESHYFLIMDLAKERKRIGLDKKPKKEKIEKDIEKTEVFWRNVYFDFETTREYKTDLNRPYAVGFYVEGNDKQKGLYKCYIKTDEHIDVTMSMLNYLNVCRKTSYIKKKILYKENFRYIGFNSSKFDNFFMVEKLIDTCDLADIQFVNCSILNMRTHKGDCFWDLCKLFPSTLKNCTHDFDVEHKKVEGFDHDHVQKQYFNSNLYGWIHDNLALLKKYLMNDVLGLKEVVEILSEQTDKILKLNLYQSPTVGNLVFKYWTRLIKEEIKVQYEEPTIIRNKFYKTASIGGRCQTYRGKLHIDNADYTFQDITSLYPYVMKKYNFPVGVALETPKYVEGKLGIYNVVINSQEFLRRDNHFRTTDIPLPIIIPKREKDLRLDWDYRAYQRCILTSVDIEQLLLYNADIEIFEGYYWEESSNDLFRGYIDIFEDLKNNQDRLNKTNDSSYNKGLRNYFKLLMNTLSGKVSQNYYSEISNVFRENGSIRTIVDVKSAYEKFKDQCKEIYPPEVLLKKKLYYISGEKKCGDDVTTKYPTHFSSFIYAYSRAEMYEKIISRCDVLYQDTDSALVRRSEYRLLREKFPEYFEDGFGTFCDDLKGKQFDKIIIIAKKCYALFMTDVDENGTTYNRPVKTIFKGVNMEKAVYWLGDIESELVPECNRTKCKTFDFFWDMRMEKPLSVCFDQFRKGLNKGNGDAKFFSKIVEVRKRFNLTF